MANHGYQTCSLCLLVMMMPERSSLKFSNQSLACLRDPFLIWFMDQLDQRPLRDMTDSSPFQCRSSLVLSIRWNRVVLRCIRCFPGVFSRHWWIFRLSADDCPLARGYGGFFWVFDPGINRILAEEKDVIKLGIGEITPLYLMGTKKNSQTHWITSYGPMPLSMSGEDEEHVSDLSVSNRKTKKSSKRRLEELLVSMEFTQVSVVSIHIFCKTFQRAGCVFSVFVEDAKTRQFVTSSHLLVVVTNNNMWDRIRWKWKSDYFRKTLIRKHRSHVNISESFSEASEFSMRCGLWRLNKEMLLTHTIRIRERSEMEKENSGFHDPLASKTYLRKASSNSLFYCVFFSLYGAYICLCNKLFSNVLYTGVVSSI